MTGMLQSEIAARQKQHTLDTAGIDEVEAKLKLTQAAVQYCGAQLSRLPSHHQTQGVLKRWVTAFAAGCLGCQASLALQRMLVLTSCWNIVCPQPHYLLYSRQRPAQADCHYDN